MMSAQQMNRMADEAAARAARRNTKPVKVTSLDQSRKIPFLGDFVPAGFKRVDAAYPGRWAGAVEGYIEVDASGFGSDREPAVGIRGLRQSAPRVLLRDRRGGAVPGGPRNVRKALAESQG